MLSSFENLAFVLGSNPQNAKTEANNRRIWLNKTNCSIDLYEAFKMLTLHIPDNISIALFCTLLSTEVKRSTAYFFELEFCENAGYKPSSEW